MSLQQVLEDKQQTPLWEISLCRYYFLGKKAFSIPHKHGKILK
jgi:hypothetical protein